MKISVDEFAKMLEVTPGELVWAVKDNGVMGGLKLPSSTRSGAGKPLMFDMKQALAFAIEYKEKNRSR